MTRQAERRRTCAQASLRTAEEVENVVPPTSTKRLRVTYIRREGDAEVPEGAATVQCVACWPSAL